MPRYTQADFKRTANWEQFLGMATTDPRFLLLENEALDRLMSMGELWVGKVQRYQFCATSSCITLPRQFETVEVTDICNRPYTMRNGWFEFLDNGPGKARIKECSTYNILDRGRGFVMFDDVRVASRIRLYPQFASDVGKVVNIRGYASTGNWVLTNGGATVGEDMVLAAPFVDSATIWMPQVFRELIKARTNGYVRAYSWDASLPAPPASPASTDTPMLPLASWEPSETVPNYRRYFIPSISTLTGCGGCGSDSNPPAVTCNKPTVTIMAKLTFVPIESDLDILPLTCAPAIKLAMLAILKQERGDAAGAQAAMHGTFDPVRRKFVEGAIPLLDDELAAFQGEGTVAPLRLESSRVDRAYVESLI